jgi:lipopolysaccharide export LptBFGC system permease protein LptF
MSIRNGTTLNNMTVDDLDTYYNDLTQAIMRYQNQERDVWRKINETNDPNYTKNIVALQAEKKLNALREERDMVMRQLSKDYNRKSKSKSAALKLRGSTKYINDLQKTISSFSRDNLAKLNSDVMTLRRLVLINAKRYSNLSHSTAYVRYIATMLCVIVLCLGFSILDFYGPDFALIGSGAIFTIGVGAVVYHYLSHLNDSKISVYEKEWPRFNKEYEAPVDENTCPVPIMSNMNNIRDYDLINQKHTHHHILEINS